MSGNTKNFKEGKPAHRQVFPSLATPKGVGFSPSIRCGFSRINRQKPRNNFWFREKISKLAQNDYGFTLVELNTTITLMAIMGVSILAIFTSFIVTSTRTNTTIEMTNDSQNLLRVMVEELRYGAGVRQTNTISDPNGPAGGWNTGNTNFVIITAVPALNSLNAYIVDPLTGKPYLNEFVYYKQGNLLYKRTLAHPSAIGNKLKTSCPPASASASCPSDRQLVENLSTMSFAFFDQDNASTTNPLHARSIKIDLTLEKDTFGAPLSYDNSIRTTLRNTF